MSITGNRSEAAPEISEGEQWVSDQHQETTEAPRFAESVDTVGSPVTSDGEREPQRVTTQTEGTVPIDVYDAETVKTSNSRRTESPKKSKDTQASKRQQNREAFHLRQSVRDRASVKTFSPGIGPASKWREDDAAAMCALLEEHKWSDNDWEEIQCLMAEVDMDTSYVRPRTAHMLEPSALVSKKGIDPDTPNLTQALSSDHASE